MAKPKAKKKCKKGFECGFTCIKRGKKCRKNASPAAEQTIEQLVKARATAAGKQIGEGEYGVVLLTPEGTAVKKAKEGFSEYEVPAQTLMGEAGYAPAVYGSGRLKNGTEYIEMQYLDGFRPAFNSKTDKVELSDKQLSKLRDAVTYLHANGYTHQDIHSYNVLVNDSTDDAKLIDYGLARPFSIFGMLTDLTWFEDELNAKWPKNSPQGAALTQLDAANLAQATGKLSREAYLNVKEDITKNYLEAAKKLVKR